MLARPSKSEISIFPEILESKTYFFEKMFVPFYSATGISAILDKLANALGDKDGG